MSKQIKLSELIPDPNNANRGTEEGKQMLEDSLTRLGAGRSVVVDKHLNLIAGNKTTKAAIALGIDDAVIVQTDGTKLVIVQRTDLDLETDEKAKLLAIADNRVGEVSLEWDSEILKGLAEEIDLSDFFSDSDIEAIANLDIDFVEDETEGKTSKDEILEPDEVNLRVQGGELVLLGHHRLLVGDCTIQDNIARLMDGQKAQMCWTDPPYNVDYDPEARKVHFSENRKNKPLGKIKNDVMSDEDFRDFLDHVYGSIDQCLDPGCAIYISHADTMGHHFRNAFVAQPWKFQSCLIWKKSQLVFGRSDYHWIHEPILYGWKEGAAHT